MNNEIKKKNLKQTAVNGFSWMFVGTVGQNLLQFATLIILARLITPSEFGVVTIAMLIIGFLKIFSELGVGPAIVQKKELSNEHIKTANTLALLLGILLSICLYFSASIIASFFNMEKLEYVIVVLSFMLPISGLSVVGQSLLQRWFKFKEIALYNLMSYIIAYGCIAIPMAFMDYGLWSLVYAYLGQIATMMIIVHIRVKESNFYGFNFKSSKELLNFGFGFSLARVSNFLAGEGDNIIVGKFLGSEALGFYGRAYQLMSMPVILFGSVMDKVLFPIMSSIQDNKERLNRAYLCAISVTAMFLMPFSAILIILSDEIILLLLGSSWNKAIPIFEILSLILVFRMSYKFSDSLARAMGAVYKRAWRQFIYAICVFLFAWIGHFWNLEGVALGIAFAIFINFLLMLELSKKLLLFSWNEVFILHLKHVVISSSLFIILFFLKNYILSYNLNSLLIITICLLVGVVYMLIIWKIFSKFVIEEFNLLKPLILKIKKVV